MGNSGISRGSYLSAWLYVEMLYIAPYETDIICIYDIEKEVFKRIALEKVRGRLEKSVTQYVSVYTG